MTEFSEIFYTKIRKYILNGLIWLKVTPNQITIFNAAMTLTAAVYFFSRGTWAGNLLGLGIMGINALLDYADGDLAKSTGRYSKLGEWLDSGFDVIIQPFLMGAIAIGCFKNGLPLVIIILFFAGLSGNNLVGLTFNDKFGFSCRAGNAMFRKYMDMKKTAINIFLKSVIDPYATKLGLILFTVRYFLIAGCLFNLMNWCFVLICLLTNIRWVVMYVIYAFYLVGYKKLWVNQALAILDEERKEFYDIRNNL